MLNPIPDETVELHEHFFRDPKVGDGVLRPPRVGLACRNIRDALRELDYAVAEGDQYDAALRNVVKDFQTEHGHGNPDGLFGPGTRKMLTRAVLARNEYYFERGRVSPEYAVFLSYSRLDEARLMGLVDGIRSHGIPVFRDKEAITPGASWPDVLFRSVRRCQVFLCMLSAHSTGSINVLIEASLARHANRPIVPVRLDAVALPGALHALIGNIQHLDLSGQANLEGGLEAVLDALAMCEVVPSEPQ